MRPSSTAWNAARASAYTSENYASNSENRGYDANVSESDGEGEAYSSYAAKTTLSEKLVKVAREFEREKEKEVIRLRT